METDHVWCKNTPRTLANPAEIENFLKMGADLTVSVLSHLFGSRRVKWRNIGERDGKVLTHSHFHPVCLRASVLCWGHECCASVYQRQDYPPCILSREYPAQFWCQVAVVSKVLPTAWSREFLKPREWYAKRAGYSVMTSSDGNIFRVTGPLCREFTGNRWIPSQWPVTRSFDVFFDLRLNKRLSKQSRRRWFEMPSRLLWRHCNAEKYDSTPRRTMNIYKSLSCDFWR